MSVLRCAVVLSGAGARGAFEAGVLLELATQRVPVRCVVGASAGALNAVAYALGVRQGQELDTAQRIVDAWRKDAAYWRFLQPDPLSWVRLRGLSSERRLMKLLRRHLQVGPAAAPVDLRLVVTALDGNGAPATSFEACERFSDTDFDSQAGLERMFLVAAASAAIPGLFAPVEIPGLGPCVDGGAVNNAPVKEALSAPDIDTVYVVVAGPQQQVAPAPDGGTALAAHLLEILIQERLYRDLREAEAVNRWLDVLGQMPLTPAQVAEIVRALYPDSPARQLRIVQIRPHLPLEGHGLAAFATRRLRDRYIDEGRLAARAVL